MLQVILQLNVKKTDSLKLRFFRRMSLPHQGFMEKLSKVLQKTASQRCQRSRRKTKCGCNTLATRSRNKIVYMLRENFG